MVKSYLYMYLYLICTHTVAWRYSACVVEYSIQLTCSIDYDTSQYFFSYMLWQYDPISKHYASLKKIRISFCYNNLVYDFIA